MRPNVTIFKSESADTWNEETFTPTTFDIIQPSATLDDGGKINYYHKLSMESGKVSIAAALMTALILQKKKSEYNGAFEEWLATNTRIPRSTAYRYMAVLTQSLGKARAAELAHDSANMQLKAVEAFTSQTNYRSLYQIYHSAGIVKKSNMGGANRGQGRKPKAETVAAAAEAIEQAVELNKVSLEQALSTIFQIVKIEDALGEIDDKFLVAFVGTLDAVHARAHEILDARKAR